MSHEHEVDPPRGVIRGEGTVEVKANAAGMARMLCLVAHPIALDLSTILPGEACCPTCAFVTPGREDTA